MTDFYKSFCPFWSKGLHIHFSPSQNVSPILLLNGDDYKWRVDCLQMFQKRTCKGVFAVILRSSFIFEILPISLGPIQKSNKAYWALLKIFLNNRKMPVIPPLFHNDKFVTGFKEKADLFNSLFAKQYSLIKNESKLLPQLNFLTDKRLSVVKLQKHKQYSIA